MSYIAELNRTAEMLTNNAKEFTYQDKLAIKRHIEYQVQNGIGPRKKKAAMKVLGLLKGV